MSDTYYQTIKVPIRFYTSELTKKAEEVFRHIGFEKERNHLVMTFDSASYSELDPLTTWLTEQEIPHDHYVSGSYESMPEINYWRKEMGIRQISLTNDTEQPYIQMNEFKEFADKLFEMDREEAIEYALNLMKKHGTAGITPIDEC